MRTKTFLLGTTSAALMAAASVSTGAIAQDNDLDVEEIVVTGIRGGLRAALDTKRTSDAIVDAISAEDIGKFPDKNIAESLQRIPGVAIQRTFGEGSDVSIRGAGAGFTKTSLNGQNVASTGWFVFEPARRSFNYTLLPSELVGNIEVYKSSQANLVEGGVGGTVIINTRKPLEMPDMSIYGSLEASSQSDSSSIDPQASGMFSWKNEEENFGVLVSGVYQKRALQRQGNEAFWEWGAGPVAFEQDRERRAFTGTLQYQASEELDLTFNYVNMQMGADNTNHALWLTLNNCSWCANPGPSSETRNGTYVEGQLNVGVHEFRPREATMKSQVFDFAADYEGDGYVAKFQAGHTKASGGTDFEMLLGGVATDLTDHSYNYRGDYLEWDLGGFDMSTFDAGTITHSVGEAFNKTPKKDRETYFQGDIEMDVDYGVVNNIKVGARFADHYTTSRRIVFNVDPSYTGVHSASSLADGLLDVGAGDYQIINYDLSSAIDAAKAAITGETEDLGSYSQIDEKNLGIYAMATFEGDGFRGNMGVRWVHTDAKSTYYLEGQLANTKASYNEFLPSFNVAVDMADDVILRASAARVLTRPQYVNMYVNPNLTGVENSLPNDQFWIVGNVGLKPFVSNQLDMNLEWYFAEGSILSAGVFVKDVKNFVSRTDYHADAADIPLTLVDPDEAAAGWTVQELNNGGSAYLHGLELQYQQEFANGFGLIANYTYTDSDVAADQFTDGNPYVTDSSKHSYNVSGYYEDEMFNARLSYNYRGRYMIRDTGAYGNRLHDGYGSLDFSGSYFVNENWTVSLDVNNLLKEDTKEVGQNRFPSQGSGFTYDFPLYQYETARRISLGVSFKY